LRYRRLLDTDDFATIKEFADVENIDPTYLSRELRMRSLAPEVVEAILISRRPVGLDHGASDSAAFQWSARANRNNSIRTSVAQPNDG
jgi:hypothetical protein